MLKTLLMKRKIAIKSRRIITTSIVTSLFLLTGIPSAFASLDEKSKEISQNSVVRTSPSILRYDNMLTGVPKSDTLKMENISGSDISIKPFMDFGPEYSSFLTYTLEVCKNEKCETVTKDTVTEIPKDGEQDMVVTITLTKDLPKDLPKVTINQGLQVVGEVHSSQKDLKIIPKIEQDSSPDTKDKFPLTLTVFGISGLVISLVCGAIFAIRKKKAKETE